MTCSQFYKKPRFAAVAFTCLLGTIASCESVTKDPVPPAPEVVEVSPEESAVAEPVLTRNSPFASEIYTFLMRDEIQAPKPCVTLFTGSSSIRFWFTLEDDFPGLDVVNRGFGGSEMEHVIDYFDFLVTPHQPKEIVLYAGENDIHAGEAPEDVFADVKRFLELKDQRLGQTPVYYIAMKPSKARWDQYARQSEANALIRNLADTRSDLVYVDIVPAMLGDGLPKDIFVRDDLHMNAEGYRLWTSLLRPMLSNESRPLSAACSTTD